MTFRAHETKSYKVIWNDNDGSHRVHYARRTAAQAMYDTVKCLSNGVTDLRIEDGNGQIVDLTV